MSLRLYALLACLFFTVSACEDSEFVNPGDSELNMLEALSERSEFSIMTDAIQKATLGEILSLYGPITLFAPDDDAFLEFFEAEEIESIAEIDEEILEALVLTHIVEGRRLYSHLDNNQNIQNLAGSFLGIRQTGGNTYINEAQMIASNRDAYNGVIHGIDRVLEPEEGLGDDARLGDVIQNDPRFSFFSEALEVTGLLSNLNSPAPYTVFIPTDEAFDEFFLNNNITRDELLSQPQRENLRNLIRYHIAPGSLHSNDFVNNSFINTLLGRDILMQVIQGQALLNNNIRITRTNLEASNGYMHIVERVMQPQ